jgi:radical SAM superfamily enzyme YgiQ (UPF0313 family)
VQEDQHLIAGGSDNGSTRRALIIDLNNFSTFPTLAVGLLVASLRQGGIPTEVLCPLNFGIRYLPREHTDTLKDHLARRLHHASWRPYLWASDTARAVRARWMSRTDRRMVAEIRRAVDERPGVVLLSAYLQHHSLVRLICGLAAERGVPVILGGPAFNMAEIADAWRHIPGVSAIVGAEADAVVAPLVRTLWSGGDLLAFDGVLLPDGRRSRPAPPLRELAGLPVPDFSDFPWDRYPHRVLPVMAGRGCQWNRCLFCNDIATASGRTFRTRPVEAVLDELRLQSERYRSRRFIFLDLKLNSYPGMLRGIVEGIQRAVPGAEWIGTVHVDQRQDNGLTARELAAAVRSGMRRVSFGLESGSQRMLDAMRKGCSVERNAAFLREAHAAGLSVRCTMFKGFPGETAADLEQTAVFLERHAPFIDRIRYNDLSVSVDTPLYRSIRRTPARYPGFRLTAEADHRDGRASYRHDATADWAYQRMNDGILRAVYAINRRPIRAAASAFDGLM